MIGITEKKELATFTGLGVMRFGKTVDIAFTQVSIIHKWQKSTIRYPMYVPVKTKCTHQMKC